METPSPTREERRLSLTELAAQDAVHRRLSTRWNQGYRAVVNDAGAVDTLTDERNFEVVVPRRFPEIHAHRTKSLTSTLFVDKTEPEWKKTLSAIARSNPGSPPNSSSLSSPMARAGAEAMDHKYFVSCKIGELGWVVSTG